MPMEQQCPNGATRGMLSGLWEVTMPVAGGEGNCMGLLVIHPIPPSLFVLCAFLGKHTEACKNNPPRACAIAD